MDTSMGLTPLAGLMMGSRCGDIDASAVTYLMEKLNMKPQEMADYLNKKSGVLGITGISSDMRDIEKAANEGNEKGLEFLGVKINKEVNDKIHGEEAIISTDDSKVKVVVVPTDEEIVIARDTKELVEKK